jgi:hypothetical protein
MKEHPVLFSTAMVEALLNTMPGTWPAEPVDPSKPFKWMTRMIVNPQPETCCRLIVEHGKLKEIWRGDCMVWDEKTIGKPKHKIGDILWARETWRCMGFDEADPGETKKILVQYEDETSRRVDFNDVERWKKYAVCWAGWKASRFMPREASRISLEVKDVRVEKLRDITPEDKKGEGFSDCHRAYPCSDIIECDTPCFMKTWNLLCSKRGYSWGFNPWVFVYEFMRVK